MVVLKARRKPSASKVHRTLQSIDYNLCFKEFLNEMIGYFFKGSVRNFLWAIIQNQKYQHNYINTFSIVSCKTGKHYNFDTKILVLDFKLSFHNTAELT